MAIIAEMTQLSPTMEVGTIVNWIKKEGDSISPGEIIAEVETDKAVMEMEAYDSGTLLAIIAGEGSKVKVGLPVAIIGDKGDDIADLKKQAMEKLNSASPNSLPQKSEDSQEKKPDTKDKESELKTKVESKTKKDGGSDKEEKSKSESVESSQSKPESKPSQDPNKKPNTGRILASPLAKSIAIQNSVDLKLVQGTGPGGRILQADVYEFMENPSSRSLSSSGVSSKRKEDQNIPISGMRKTIADRLTSSKVNLPHFYLNMELDAMNLVAFRERINEGLQGMDLGEKDESLPDKPIKISFNDIIVRAVALSLEKHPQVNASWKEEKIVQYGRVDLGIAVSIDEGLITPVLRDANAKGLLAISQEISHLASKAKKRKLKPEEFTNSTFTISNLGMYGISFFTAIINEPESAILAVGAIEEKPVIRRGELVAGKTLQLTLSCDHRVVDGAEGAKFLGTLKRFLENPELMTL